MKRTLLCVLSIVCGLTTGCQRDATDETEKKVEVPETLISAGVPEWMSIDDLRQKLNANENAKFGRIGQDIVRAELFDSGVTDISGLKGLPLRVLSLKHVPVDDLSVLEGMPLKELHLERAKDSETNFDNDDLNALKDLPLEILNLKGTNVSDLSALAGLKLREIDLFGTKVTDVSPLKEMPLETILLQETEISDISSLAELRPVNLDVRDTQIASLDALIGMTTLKELNIANTPVSDLTPLKNLKLTRLIFTPENIKQGIDVVRDMKSIVAIGPSAEEINDMTVQGFWRKYDTDRAPKEEPKKDDPKKDDPKKDDPKKDDPKKDDPKKDDPKKDEGKKDEGKKDEGSN